MRLPIFRHFFGPKYRHNNYYLTGTLRRSASNKMFPVVKVNEGLIKGKTIKTVFNQTVFGFIGVPFAKSPINELRFKSPVPVEPWEGVKDTTRDGNACPSMDMRCNLYVGSEQDCLHVNIFTATLPNGESKPNLKPVMVWVHGGAFLYGNNKEEIYGPDYLITEDVVIVTVNYRLGALGFLSLEEPSLNVPGNAGLKDIILALKWVQSNITKFNGDPNNVTLFGQSAGGAAVHYLYLSPQSKGLFHKAIVQSGHVYLWARGRRNALDIATGLNLKETEEKEILSKLMELPAKSIVFGQQKIQDHFLAGTIRPFGPVIENSSSPDAIITEEPEEIIRKGTFNKVPLMIGYTSNEGIFIEGMRLFNSFSFSDLKIPSDINKEVPYDLNMENNNLDHERAVEAIKTLYYNGEEPGKNNIHGFYKLKSDIIFNYGIYKSLNLFVERNDMPIYFYKMSLVTPNNFLKLFLTVSRLQLIPVGICAMFAYLLSNGLIKNLFVKAAHAMLTDKIPGAAHADDLAYLFKLFISPQLKPGSTEEIAVRRFVKLWTNFAKTSNPTPDSADELLKVKWEPLSQDQMHLLEIDEELKMVPNSDLPYMEFWDSLYKIQH